jgi:pyruvate kinase
LAFVWGVRPWPIPHPRSTEDLLESALGAVREAGVARAGESIVLTGATPMDSRGRTNFLHVRVLE